MKRVKLYNPCIVKAANGQMVLYSSMAATVLHKEYSRRKPDHLLIKTRPKCSPVFLQVLIDVEQRQV